jgi:hypothetical protein
MVFFRESVINSAGAVMPKPKPQKDTMRLAIRDSVTRRLVSSRVSALVALHFPPCIRAAG